MTSPLLRHRTTLAAGLAWALLYLRLAWAGARPSFAAGLPVDAGHYYLAAALWALPVFWGVAALHDVVARRTAATALPAGALGSAFAAAVLAGLILPEHVALSLGGPDALRATARVAGPLTLALCLAGPWRRLRSTGVGRGRAAAASALGLIAAGLPMGFLLR
jgi:hypothetical protein